MAGSDGSGGGKVTSGTQQNPALQELLHHGIDEFRQFVNPLVALRAQLAGEPHRITRIEDGALVDADGNIIEDLHGTQAFGHRHPHIAAALIDYLQSDSPSWFPSRVNPFAGRLARRLHELTGCYDSFFFNASGTDAVEAALKLARAATRRRRILSIDGAYHGCSFGSVALMTNGAFREPFAPHLPGVEGLPFNDVAALERAFAGGDIAALVVEPIQIEGGVRALSPEFVQAACALTEQHGALLVADEVQTGMGRTGRFLFTESWPRRPDAVLLGKMLGGGLVATAALLTKQELFERAYGQNFETAEGHNATFSGNAVSCVAALAALELVTPQLMAENLRKGSYLREQLTAAIGSSPLVAEVRSWGMILGIELRAAEHPWLSFDHFGMGDLARHPTVGLLLCRRLYRRGFYGFVCGHNWSVLRLQPRFTITQERMDQFICALKEEIEYLCALN